MFRYSRSFFRVYLKRWRSETRLISLQIGCSELSSLTNEELLYLLENFVILLVQDDDDVAGFQTGLLVALARERNLLT